MSYSFDPDDPPPFRDEPDDDDEMFSRRERSEGGRSNLVGEFVRRAIENTVGQAKSTGTLSREALMFLLQQGDRGKKEIVRVVAKEVGDFLRHVDLSSEVVKVLTGLQVDFQASVRFRKNPEGAVEPVISSDAGVSLTEPTEGSASAPRSVSSSSSPSGSSTGSSSASSTVSSPSSSSAGSAASPASPASPGAAPPRPSSDS
ncbi:MAG: hypothetical protein IPK13_16645 [Deltaproteobacteria bacterium]|nr:hypothetical protein [Deltaproteobacteria bacterium]